MSWLVDTCIIIDIARKDPTWGYKSALFLEERRQDGLVCCPITLIETAPQFGGEIDMAREFIKSCDIECQETWSNLDTANSFNAWARYFELKKKGLAIKRPIADILIGGFAKSLKGLITRNETDFRSSFPNLKIIGPN